MLSLLSHAVFTRGSRCWAAVLLLVAVSPFASMRTGATSTYTATTVAALIADINTANTNPTRGPYTINLVGGTRYTLATEATTGSETGLPAIASGVDLTIVGNGATVERDATATSLRLFLIDGGGTLRLTALTLRNGQVTGTAGTSGSDGTGNPGVSGGSAHGGAIYNNGTLVLTSDTFVQNGVSGGAGGNGGSGTSGGIAGGPGGGGGTGGDATGGAIYNAGT
ncbi:MAG: hypothetical protein LC793_23585, partial [Thermomicrobia bacterium]|nr:hypothetical protein [Thermomicrobia bacterium]